MKYGLTGYSVIRFVGYFVGYTSLWGIVALVSVFFPPTKSTTDLIPPAVLHFLSWPFYMTCLSAIAFPLLKGCYGLIAEDISNRAAIKANHANHDAEFRSKLYRETDSMNWELGLADQLFPGNQE